MNTAQIFKEAMIYINVEVPNKENLISFISSKFSNYMNIDYNIIRDGFCQRESMGATTIGNGIAIPHTLSAKSIHPAALIARLSTAIRFNAEDNNEVDILCALIWPKASAAGFYQTMARLNPLLCSHVVMTAIRQADCQEKLRYQLIREAEAAQRMDMNRLMLI